MKFLQGTDRSQVEIYTQSLDQTIEVDNVVWVRNYPLAFFAFSSSFLTSLEPFWRIQKKQFQTVFYNIDCVTIDLFVTLVGQNLSKIIFKEPY